MLIMVSNITTRGKKALALALLASVAFFPASSSADTDRRSVSSVVLGADGKALPNPTGGDSAPSAAPAQRDSAETSKLRKLAEQRRNGARKLAASKDMTFDQIGKKYPFIASEFQGAITAERKIASMKAGDDVPAAAPPSVFKIIEDQDEKSKTNLLFVTDVGRYTCGRAGCTTSIYVDKDDQGYKKAMDALSSGDVYVTRSGDDVSLFLGDPKNPDSVEWQLKNGKFFKVDTLTTPGGTPVDPKGAELAYGPNWMEKISAYEKRRDDFKAAQSRRLSTAQSVTFTEGEADKIRQDYPFLREEIAAALYGSETSQKIDRLHFSVGQSINGPVQFIFLYSGGKDGRSCPESGCKMAVYMNDGTGFKLGARLPYTGGPMVSTGEESISVFVPNAKGDTPTEYRVKDHELEKVSPPDAPG